MNWEKEDDAHETLHIRPRIKIRQFTSIYLNLIQKTLDCCVELQMDVDVNGGWETRSKQH